MAKRYYDCKLEDARVKCILQEDFVENDHNDNHWDNIDTVLKSCV